MSQFYASIQGGRGLATRQGTKNSGMYGHIRGWDVGAIASMDYNEETKQDEVTVSLTGGSNSGISGKKLGVWVRKGNGFKKVY